MRSSLTFATAAQTICLLIAFGSARGDEPPPANIRSLEQRIAELERQLASVKKELQASRSRLPSAPEDLSPAAAVKAGPTKVVTVEFGVGSASHLSDSKWPHGSGPVPPIVLQWDNSLPGGGSLFVVLNGHAVSRHVAGAKGGERADEVPPYPSVRQLEQFCKSIRGRGIRVTGRIQPIGPPWSMNYQLVIEDPERFQIIK